MKWTAGELCPAGLYAFSCICCQRCHHSSWQRQQMRISMFCSSPPSSPLSSPSLLVVQLFTSSRLGRGLLPWDFSVCPHLWVRVELAGGLKISLGMSCHAKEGKKHDYEYCDFTIDRQSVWCPQEHQKAFWVGFMLLVCCWHIVLVFSLSCTFFSFCVLLFICLSVSVSLCLYLSLSFWCSVCPTSFSFCVFVCLSLSVSLCLLLCLSLLLPYNVHA